MTHTQEREELARFIFNCQHTTYEKLANAILSAGWRRASQDGWRPSPSDVDEARRWLRGIQNPGSTWTTERVAAEFETAVSLVALLLPPTPEGKPSQATKEGR